MEARYRRVLLGATAVAVFAVVWVIAAACHLSADSAVPTAAAADAIALMFIAPYVPGPVKPPEAAGKVLAEARDRLRQTLQSQVGQQARALIDRGVLTVPWTGGPSYTRATVPELASIVDGGQLIVFGVPQSGKTTLATRLAEELGTQSARQPVLFSLATWSPSTVYLKDWMLQTIRNSYGLASPADLTAAQATLREGRILPIFDGLDEIGASDLISAADAIRNEVGAAPTVVTSIRTPETDRAARAALPAATIITLAPVQMQEVSRYLLDSPYAEPQELAPITSAINDPGSPVGQALSSPLMAWLAKTIYAAGGAATRLRGVARPDELTNRKLFGDVESVEKHLLRALPISVFERYRLGPRADGSPAAATTPEQAERWLAFLAARATRRIIAFWDFYRYAPLFRIALVSAVVIGCAIAAVGNAVRYFAGPGYLLLLAGGVFGIGWSRGYATRDKVNDPTRLGYNAGQSRERIDLHQARFMRAVAAAIVAYASGVVLQAAQRGTTSWPFGLTPREFGTAAFVATVGCFLVANVGGRMAARILLSRPDIDARMGARAGDPLAAIRSDKRSGVVIFVIATTVLGAGIALYDIAFLTVAATWNVCIAPLGAGIAASIWNEWLPFKVSHLWLVLRGWLPLHLSEFLRQCHEGGILRKNGNHFEFRHLRLQESLRNPTTGDSDTRSWR